MSDESFIANQPSRRTLAVDWGSKRTGLAICDELGLTVRPFATLTILGSKALVARIAEIVVAEDVTRVVVGLSRRLDGTSNHATDHILKFVERLRKAVTCPVLTRDERLTSFAAEDWLREHGVPHRKWKELTDQVAAALLLEEFLAAE
jgi:putative holliday junction resolvase